MENNWVTLDLSSPVDRKYLKDKEWVKLKTSGSEYMIAGFTYDVIYEGDGAKKDVRVLLSNDEYYSADELFDTCTFLDGSIIGKRILNK